MTDYARIPLRDRNGLVRAYTLVTPDDEPRVSGRRWFLSAYGYAVASDGTRMHRVLMGLTAGDKVQVDHINRVRLDNRRSNLRLCDASGNQQNRQPMQATSPYRGVSRAGEKWLARGKLAGVVYHLGYFTDELAAADAAAAFRRERMPFSPEATA